MPTAPMTWAERLRRVFHIGITTCPDCGGRLRWIADVIKPTLTGKILLHVRSRAPPGSASCREHRTQADTPFIFAG